MECIASDVNTLWKASARISANLLQDRMEYVLYEAIDKGGTRAKMAQSFILISWVAQAQHSPLGV